jgi:hypothetical protein
LTDRVSAAGNVNMSRINPGPEPLEPDVAVLLEDLRRLAIETPLSGAKNRAGRKYVPTRFSQAVENAAAKKRVVERVQEWLKGDVPADGFNPVMEVGRPDLTIEWLVLDETKPYRHRFTEQDRASARRRLGGYGHGSA